MSSLLLGRGSESEDNTVSAVRPESKKLSCPNKRLSFPIELSVCQTQLSVRLLPLHGLALGTPPLYKTFPNFDVHPAPPGAIRMSLHIKIFKVTGMRREIWSQPTTEKFRMLR